MHAEPTRVFLLKVSKWFFYPEQTKFVNAVQIWSESTSSSWVKCPSIHSLHSVLNGPLGSVTHCSAPITPTLIKKTQKGQPFGGSVSQNLHWPDPRSPPRLFPWPQRNRGGHRRESESECETGTSSHHHDLPLLKMEKKKAYFWERERNWVGAGSPFPSGTGRSRCASWTNSLWKDFLPFFSRV